jgi:hypothetical protein
MDLDLLADPKNFHLLERGQFFGAFHPVSAFGAQNSMFGKQIGHADRNKVRSGSSSKALTRAS